MKAIPSYFRLLPLVILLACTSAHAAVESIVASLAGVQNAPIVQNAMLTAQDQWYPFPIGWNSIFRVNNAKANVVLRYDDSQRTYAGNTTWTLDITYTLVQNDATGAVTSTTGETLHIAYDPQDGTKYIDRDMREYANAHKAKLIITAIAYNEWNIATATQTVTNQHVLPTFLKDVYLDLEIHVERFYNITTAPVPVLYTALNFSTNELDVNWNYVQGAESYDLEWLFIDAGSDAYPFTNSYDYDWHNAARVNVPNQHYSIPLTYPKGILLIRARAVGVDWDNYVNNNLITRGEGDWTSTAPTGNTGTYGDTRYDIQTGLLPGMNWAYSAGFAEDGKRMDGAGFYDGMMRSRESIATANTDGNVIVGDAAYDFEGRPAVSYLPYPEVNNGIKFYPANSAYNCQNFDKDSKVGAPDAMGTIDGSGAYYSTTGSSAVGINGNTPDAGNFPYARVTYASDGTNRPATSTGVGENLKEGSGKETKYFYGTPSQVQLDRLFGNEVGYASHYKKNFTIDPNGVTSISYIDLHGRVIATALAGTPPANLQAIDNPNGNPEASTPMTDNLLDNNGHREENDGTESQATITVTETSLYSFSYSLSNGNYCDSCSSICKDCKYDLTIMLSNTSSGDSIDINTTSAAYAIRDYNINSGTETFSVTLTPGTYRVQKTLTLNQGNLDQVRQDYLDNEANNHTCVPLVSPVPVPCAGDCHESCVNHYYVSDGSGGHEYVDDNGTPLDNQGSTESDPGPMLIAACQQTLCDQPATPDPCAVKYNAMLDDMSPGGQYFDNLPGRFHIDPTSGLQTAVSEWDINEWLLDEPDHAAMLTAVNNYPGTGAHSFTTWTQVRDNWDPGFATVLVSYHPEYCAWNYFCNWSCAIGDGGPENGRTAPYTEADEYAYDQATQYEADGNVSGSDGFYWNPLNMMVNGSAYGYGNDNAGFLPYGTGNTDNQDPRFAGDCDFTICDDPSRSAESALAAYLQDFYPAYTSSNTFIGYYSLWYVAIDPDNIAGIQPSSLSAGTLNLFLNLHGNGSTIPGLISNTPAAGQVTPYQFFRSAYYFYRNLVIEQGFAGDANVASCQSAHGTTTPLYDSDGYLAGSTDNPVITPQGFTILYPHSSLIDIYGNGCSSPSITDLSGIMNDMIDEGAANPNNIDNEAPAAGAACSCQMLSDFITEQGLSFTAYTDIANALNDEFVPATPYSAVEVQSWLSECENSVPSQVVLDAGSYPTELTCNSDVGVTDLENAVQTNCDQENLDLATYNASFTYQAQLQAAVDAFIAAYSAYCVSSANETFTVDYSLHEYYYTLYYYDQAGNLVKTVPPEGVNLIDLTQDDVTPDGNDDGPEITTYRNDFRDGTITGTVIFTPAVHDMRSVYAYNSLQQPVHASQNEQGNTTSAPDLWESGETKFWYDYLGRLVVSQNTKQALMSPQAYSYTVYDQLGRISEVGEIHTTTLLSADASGSRDNNLYYYYYDFDHATSPTELENWLNGATDPGMSKNDVTYTYYDEEMTGINGSVTAAFGSAGQENLRNRVSSVVYDDDPNTSSNLYADAGTVSSASGFLNAFHYSYDVHGNVKAMVQETPPLATHNEDLKMTTYDYDLVSGNVNAVYYQQGQRDEFDHKYEYDADNRLHESFSSRDGKTWEKESKQFYYATGGIARMEIGDKTVQGEDYVYTINGWLKGMNRNTIGDNGRYMARDIGQDAEGSSSNNNKNFGADAAGFSLSYWQTATGITADYTAVSSATPFEATTSSTAYGSAIVPQYNGNIAGMVTSMLDHGQSAVQVQGRAFSYDQLYRIKESHAFHMDHTALAGNAWQSSYTQDKRYEEDFSYDWNGNIKTVQRYAGNVVSGTAVKEDDLAYNYATNSNLLTHIGDLGASACTYTDDLDDQSAGNYDYDQIGALAKDDAERITAIDWNPYGKMKAVHKDPANNTNPCTSSEYADADVEYLYTASQQRLCKIVKPHKLAGAGISDQDQWTYYWYAYDAGGQLMTVYKQSFEDLHSSSTYKVHFDVQEHDVYGSGRLGIRKGDDDGKYYMDFTGAKATTGPDAGKFNSVLYSGGSSAFSRTHYTRELGNKQYEIANHLGNVLVTVSDKRLPYSATPTTATTVDWYVADVLSYSDYYVFGAAQPGRNGGSSDYRYGFNGKENDPETHDGAATQDYGMRMYDPRVGRFFSADPLMFKYPYLTPYQFAENMPIIAIDLDGGEREIVNGAPLGSGAGAGAGAGSATKAGSSTGEKSGENGAEYNVIINPQKLSGGGGSKIIIPNTVTNNRKPIETPEVQPSQNAKSIKASESSVQDKLTYTPKSDYEQWAEGTSDGPKRAADEFFNNPFKLVGDGISGTADFLGDMFLEGLNTWSKPRSGYELMTLTPVTPTGRSMLRHSTPYESGFALGYGVESFALTYYAGDLVPIGGRYLSNAGGSVENGIVYRALTVADKINYESGMGLAAKNPLGAWELEEHLIKGSSKSAFSNSPWISTTTDLRIAKSFDSGNGIVAIDLSLVPESNIEVGFLKYNRSSPAYHFSIWQQEISIFQHIPPSAIKGYVK